MKQKIIFIIILLFYTELHAGNLSLKDIFNLIIENSTDIDISKSELEEARLEVKDAYSNLWPDVKVNGSFVKNHEEIIFEFEDMEVIMQPDTSKSVSLNIEQPLMQLRVLDLGRAAKKNLISVENTHQHKVEDLLYQSSEIFLQLIMEKYSLKILQEALKQLREHHKWAETSYKNGRILKSDLLLFSYQIVDTESKITSVNNNIDNLKKSLSVLTGLEDNFLIKEDFSFQVTEQEKNFSVSKWIDIARENRKDYLAAVKAKESLEYIISSTDKEKYPSLSAFFDMNYQFEESGFSEDRSSWVAGVSMNWKAYERGSRKIRIEQYTNLKNRYGLISEQITERIEVAVSQTINNLSANVADMQAMQERNKYAEELYRLRKKEMEIGRAATTDLLDALVNYTESKLSLKILEIRKSLSWLSVYKNAGIFLKKFNLHINAE